MEEEMLNALRHLEEEAVEKALGSNPSASEYRAMRSALKQRLQVLQEERARQLEIAACLRMDEKIEEMQKQLQVLRQEEAISEFVERQTRMAVRNSLKRERDFEEEA